MSATHVSSYSRVHTAAYVSDKMRYDGNGVDEMWVDRSFSSSLSISLRGHPRAAFIGFSRAKRDGGKRDTDLGAGKRGAHETQHSTECHHHRERDRQQLDCGRPELRAP